MTPERMTLHWDGLSNARDLGGILLGDGRVTRSGVFVRSDHPTRLTARGWAQLHRYGVRTIVSLETAGLHGEEDLRSNRPVVIPAEYDTRLERKPVEDASDRDFMGRWARTGLWGTPLYFADALRRWPRLYGDALATVAGAERGVLVHCGRGHDRTGILSLLLLTLSGVGVAGITDDYLQSITNERAREPSAVELFENAMTCSGSTVTDAIAAAVAVVDGDWLRRAGVSPAVAAAIRGALAG
jgi:protein-tyrosine phosphatase